MALIHHDSRGYEAAATEAAREARAKMEKLIDGGRVSAMRLIEHVNTKVPSDQLVRGRALGWSLASTGGLGVEMDGVEPMTVHAHAMGQIAERAGVPRPYLASLLGADEQSLQMLAVDILDRHYRTTGLAEERHLCRSIDGQLRGFLSDRYRRLDSRPLVDAFATACESVGAVPVEGVVTDTRLQLKAYLPMVFEPVPHEVMLVGLAWNHSDFGAGAHTLSLTVLRLACTNKAVWDAAIRNVHIGRRLDENIEYSERTYRLDTDATASALKDTGAQLLGPGKVNSILETIRAADAERIEWRDVNARLAKTLTKGELNAAKTAFESNDVVNLPPEKSVWRVSNAISWIAGHAESDDRRLELERLAGTFVATDKAA